MASYPLTTIGNTIVDLGFFVKDEFLIEQNLSKGAMTWVDAKRSDELKQYHPPEFENAGGSSSNTLVGFTSLGGKGQFIGMANNDNLGKFFKECLLQKGAQPHLFSLDDTSLQTGRCLIFVTEDGERTMATYLGISNHLLFPSSVHAILSQSSHLLLEGYLFEPLQSYNTIIQCASYHKQNHGKVILSLSDVFCVTRHRENMLDFTRQYVDILLSNYDEASLFSNETDDKHIIEFIRQYVKIGVITKGHQGALVFDEKEIYHVSSFNLHKKIIDTTGAGDQFAAGFLYALIEGMPLSKAGQLGAYCAGHIITQWGGQLHTRLKDDVIRGDPWSIGFVKLG